ncbi:hypothetical protein Tco_0040714 [Tanacetum coccineum]
MLRHHSQLSQLARRWMELVIQASVEGLWMTFFESIDDTLQPSSGSPKSSDLSLPDYEAFSNDHIEETSSGSTTTYSNSSFSKYDSFIFDLSINSYHPSNRSDFYHEEFADETRSNISQTRSGYQQKDRKPSQNDKTEHGMEKTVQNQGQSLNQFQQAHLGAIDKDCEDYEGHQS